MFFLLACSSVRMDGVAPIGSVASAVAIDVSVDHYFIVGLGDVGPARGTSLVLTSEAGWCAGERERIAQLEGLADAVDASDDPLLCDIGGPLLAGTLAVERDVHDADRRTLFADVCAGPDCAWDAVPAGATLDVPTTGDVSTYGGYTVMSAPLEGGAELWNEADCQPSSGYWDMLDAALQRWEVTGGTLTFDAVDDRMPGTYAGQLADMDGAVVGDFDAEFSAQRCEITAARLVGY